MLSYVGITIAWQGSGVDEVGYDIASGKELVRIDAAYFRPAEVDLLLGDPSKAQRRKLGWYAKTTFKDLVSLMMEHDLSAVQRKLSQ